MKNLYLNLVLLLLASICISRAIAEDISIPDNVHRQGMSYQEYATFREKMRMQIEKTPTEDNKQIVEPTNSGAGNKETKSGRTYGQGYHTRMQTEDRPGSKHDKRPDRPRIERFNRGDMRRR